MKKIEIRETSKLAFAKSSTVGHFLKRKVIEMQVMGGSGRCNYTRLAEPNIRKFFANGGKSRNVI